MKNLKENISKVILEAGEIFINTEIKKELIEVKSFANFVTEIDYKVQDFLVERLKGIISGCNIITEESKNNEFNLEKPTFIIDPVDGTTNLMYNYQHSAISVALYLEGKPYMGFVYDPYVKELFYAEKGKGAYINDKKIKVSENKTLEDSLIGFGTSPYDKSKADATFDTLKKLYKVCRDIRRSGSAALDLCYVAAGRMDGFFELTLQPWDFAAGSIILEEAGGKTSDWNGKELNILKPSSIVASNKFIHKELMEVIRDEKI